MLKYLKTWLSCWSIWRHGYHVEVFEKMAIMLKYLKRWLSSWSIWKYWFETSHIFDTPVVYRPFPCTFLFYTNLQDSFFQFHSVVVSSPNLLPVIMLVIFILIIFIFISKSYIELFIKISLILVFLNIFINSDCERELLWTPRKFCGWNMAAGKFLCPWVLGTWRTYEGRLLRYSYYHTILWKCVYTWWSR